MAYPTYKDVTHWEKYQIFFPEQFRCLKPDSIPIEERWNWKGLDVHLDRLEVPSSKLKVIVLHGLGGYGRLLAPVCLMIKNLGYSTVAPDLPGYGLTQSRLGAIKYNDWVQLTSDLIDAELRKDPQQPVVLFGLSIGGFMAYQAATRSGKTKGVVASTLIDLRNPKLIRPVMRSELLGSLGLPLLQAFSPLIDRLPLPMGKMIKMETMSNDESFNQVVLNDRQGGAAWVSAGFLKSISETKLELEPESFKLPLLLVHPSQDHMTPFRLSEPFFNRLSGPKKLVMLENCGHAPIEEPGIYQLEEAVRDFLGDVSN